jgi:hypothetical protein
MLSMTAGQTSASVSPVYVPDLRPTADSAALRRQADPVTPVSVPPASAFPPVAPPSAVAQGEVGRSLLAAVSMAGANVDGGDERRLKPWGVAMLPSGRPEPEPEPKTEPRTAMPAARAEAQPAEPSEPVRVIEAKDRETDSQDAGRETRPAQAPERTAAETPRETSASIADRASAGASAETRALRAAETRDGRDKDRA